MAREHLRLPCTSSRGSHDPLCPACRDERARRNMRQWQGQARANPPLSRPPPATHVWWLPGACASRAKQPVSNCTDPASEQVRGDLLCPKGGGVQTPRTCFVTGAAAAAAMQLLKPLATASPNRAPPTRSAPARHRQWQPDTGLATTFFSSGKASAQRVTLLRQPWQHSTCMPQPSAAFAPTSRLVPNPAPCPTFASPPPALPSLPASLIPLNARPPLGHPSTHKISSLCGDSHRLACFLCLHAVV